MQNRGKSFVYKGGAKTGKNDKPAFYRMQNRGESLVYKGRQAL
jgi:hypothetical protein